ncbi:MAG: glycosyltransferase family 39 protein, partial [Candidatus Latescibacterota bacterium]
MTGESRWWRFLWPAVLVAVPCLVYLQTLGYPFQYDDFHSIVDNYHLRDPRNLLAFFVDPTLFSARPEHAMYRPLLLVTLALNWAVSGSATWSYHLVNLALHAGCGLLLWRIGHLLLGDRDAAGVGALVFALHPINSEAVCYLSSRSETLAAFFVLLGFSLFLRRRQQGGGMVLLVAAFSAGLLAKSTAAVLPALILAHDLLWTPGQVGR